MHRLNNGAAALLLAVASGTALGTDPTALGRDVFMERCSVCHGEGGRGDGRLAKMISDPPVADLTHSRLPPGQLARIVREGGAAVGRSARMPAWGPTLTPAELDAVVAYVSGLRAPSAAAVSRR